MDRPVTSKSRGICRYYTTPRGCFAGDDCKFLHGAAEKLTPYDKTKVCRYYAMGHCTRGDKCWFRHVLPKIAPNDERVQYCAETCCICLEKPTIYGLLTDCNHVFCLECIRQWRTPTGKSPDVISSGAIKCCPLCRTPSRFVTPSAHFFPNSSTRKKETTEAYKASMARVPCKYFEETSRTGKPCCPFGLDCFYRHTNTDGTPHVFRHGAKHSMNVYRLHRLRSAGLPPPRFDYDDPVEFLQHIFENPITNLHATLDVIRASLPALMERFASSNDWVHDPDEDGDIGDDINPFDLLQENLVLTTESATSNLPSQSTTDEASLQPQGTPVEPHDDDTPSTTARTSPIQSTSPRPSALSPRFSSRFSTVMESRSRETLIIDISDDDDDDDREDEPLAQMLIARPDGAIESPDTDADALAGPSYPQSALPEQPPVSLDSTGNSEQPVETTPSRPQCEHEVDPPFLTDGRGRVVWSSPRNGSGRGAAAEPHAPRRSRTGSTPRTTRPSSSSTFLATSGRGHAWGGQDIQEIEGKVAGGDERSDSD